MHVPAPMVCPGLCLLVFVAACSGDEGTTGSTTTAVQVTTSATVVEDPVDPFIGRWLTIDGYGLEVEIVISPSADNGYAFLMTYSHSDACVEFGAPVTGFLSGRAQATGSEIRLTSESLMCRTDWGDIDKAISTAMVL